MTRNERITMFYFANGNSFGTDDTIVATLPWIFRHAVPGWHDRT